MVDLGNSKCQGKARRWVKGKGCTKKGKRNGRGKRRVKKRERPSEDEERTDISTQGHIPVKDLAGALSA